MLPLDLRREANTQESETYDDIPKYVTRQFARRRVEDKRTSRKKKVDFSDVGDKEAPQATWTHNLEIGEPYDEEMLASFQRAGGENRP